MRTTRYLVTSCAIAALASSTLLVGATSAGATDDPVATESDAFDLSMQLVVDATEPLAVGDTAAYALSVANLGPSAAASGWTVTNPIPEGLTSVAVEPAPESLSYSCVLGDDELSCSFDGELAAGETAPLATVTAVVSDASVGSERIAHTACVGNNAGDTDGGNDCASATTLLQPTDPVTETEVQGVVLAAPTQAEAPQELAATGSDNSVLLATGAALVLFGSVVMRLGRRREGDPS